MAETPTADLTARRGNTYTVTFGFLNQDETPVNLSGSEIIFRATHPAIKIRKSYSGGTLTLDGPAGEVSVTLTKAETRFVPAGKVMKYELERRIDGNEETLIYGMIDMQEAVNDDV